MVYDKYKITKFPFVPVKILRKTRDRWEEIDVIEKRVNVVPSNFDFLEKYWPDMAKTGQAAELYLHRDPNVCIYKLGLLAEQLAQVICFTEQLDVPEMAGQADRLRSLRSADLLPKRIDDIFYAIRRARNSAVHAGDARADQAEGLLHLAFHLCCWFMEVYGDWQFTAPAYRIPAPSVGTEDLEKRLREQEKTVQELMRSINEIRTEAAAHSRSDRTRKSQEAARKLPVTQAEQTWIDREPVRIELDVLPVVSYALQQNGMAAVRSVTLTNDTDEELRNLELRISAVPAFLMPYTRHVDCLPAHRSVVLTCADLKLDPGFLAGVTERVNAVLDVSLIDQVDRLTGDSTEIGVLPFDYWYGTSCFPELLAAFVMPNDPQIARIIARATEFLGKWTGDTSMDAYQTQDPNRVLRQAAAIYTAIQEQGIAYAVPPASFESTGQKVRLCDTVLQQKLGTCLDLTVLYAACLEAVGLHPLLITVPGHIFAGVWIQDLMFPEAVQDDVSRITNRLASGVNEIAVVETTGVTSGSNLSFDDARSSAEKTLVTEQL